MESTFDINIIDKMDGKEFEDFLGKFFETLGYEVTVTKYSGDFGADLILKSSNAKIVIQAKCYKNKVPLKAIQEITSAKNFYHATAAWVITNSYYTFSAKQLAYTNNVLLIDRDSLIETLSKNQVASSHYTESYDVNLDNSVRAILSNKSGMDFVYLASLNSVDEIMKYYNELSQRNLSCIEKHFLYIQLCNNLYKLRKSDERALKFCEKFCDMDFKELTYIANELNGCTLPTLTRKLLFLEKRKQYIEIIRLCDLFDSYNFLDSNKKSFSERKKRIQKKLSNK